MRVMGFTVLLVVAVAAGAVVAGPTYRWVDAQGQVHYSDRAEPGAEEVQLQGIQSYSPPAIDTTEVGSTPAPTSAAADDALVPKAVTIASPTPDQTLWNTGGRLPVAVKVDPALQAGQRVNVYLDGNRVVDGEPGRLAFELGDVWRGEHSLSATVENTEGNEILRSEAIRFYVQQTSVQQPRVP
jgi:hypothetical protein